MEDSSQPLRIVFNEKDYLAIARLSGLSERGVRRILGSVSVLHSDGSQVDAGEIEARSFQLGMRIVGIDGVRLATAQMNSPVETVCRCLMEYQGCCPAVVQWLNRGDFDPRRVPREISSAFLLHASRTAGRVRATCIRNLAEPPSGDNGSFA